MIPRLGSFLLLRTRPHDNVKIDFGVPNEDELALCTDMGLSPYLTWAFPRQAGFYDRFLTLKEATDDERARWRASLLHFLKKLTFKSGRPLVLKSPPHTARIDLLLDLFPTARFVHIRRDPYVVFRSTKHMYAATMRYWQLQRPVSPGFDDRIIAVYRTMYDAFFDQWPSIPTAQRCEVVYEELVRDPIGQSRDPLRHSWAVGLRRPPSALDGLPGVDRRLRAEHALRSYPKPIRAADRAGVGTLLRGVGIPPLTAYTVARHRPRIYSRWRSSELQIAWSPASSPGVEWAVRGG